MDIVIEKKAKSATKKFAVPIVIVLGLAVAAYAWASRSTASYVVDSDRILFDQVTQGDLTITVRGMGVLAPKDVRWLATTVPGRVERIHVKAGAQVKQGDVILELSNPQLEQQLDETRWELDELKAQLLANKVALESDLLDQEAAVINAKLNHDSALLTYNAHKKLIAQGFNAVSQIDHEAIKIEVAQTKQRWELEISRLNKQKERAKAQLVANDARIRRMERTLSRVSEQVDGLLVKASIDAIVQEMPMELGQQVIAGTNLARLAKRDAFIAEIRIAENQIQNIAIGQKVSINTRNSIVEGSVKRIDPTVTNGVVQVDVDLIGETPREARPELTVEGTIEVSHIDEAIYVKRPMYAKSYDEGYVYLLDTASNTASKHKVMFGNASSSHIEIQSGLTAGQQIIVSDVSAWETHQTISIN